MIRGGIFRHMEQAIPLHRIGRVIREQDLIGSRFGYGTIIFQSITGDERSAGQDGGAGTGAWVCRNPLACFFGIRDPETAQRIIGERMGRPSRED